MFACELTEAEHLICTYALIRYSGWLKEQKQEQRFIDSAEALTDKLFKIKPVKSDS